MTKNNFGPHIAGVLHLDIAGSTQIQEQIQSIIYSQLVAKYFHAIDFVLAQNFGIPISFGGDSITAIFNGQVPKKNAYFGCRAGIQLLKVIRQFNRSLLLHGYPAFVTRIGIEVGVITGIVDSLAEPALQYILTGKPFNHAQRLQELARPFNESTVIVGQRAKLTLAEHQGNFHFEALETQTLRGTSTPMTPYRLLPQKSHNNTALSPFCV